MAKGYFRSYTGKCGPLRFMDVSVGYECNFQCGHCSSEALKRDGKILSIEEYQRIASDAISCGVMAFHFTGGEPLLREDLFDIIEAFQPTKNLISIQTNGWHADVKFLNRFKNIGGDIVCVSVDSVSPLKHDSFRKKTGSWRRAVLTLQEAKARGLKTILSATVTHETMNDGSLERLAEFALQLGAILSLNLAVPAGNWRGETSCMLTPADRVKLNSFIDANPHVRTDFESNWHRRGCSAFKEKCYLTPYGDVIPCPFIHVSFGNVRDESIGAIREHALKSRWMTPYHPICLAAESAEFMDEAGCYDDYSGRLPLHYTESRAFR